MSNPDKFPFFVGDKAYIANKYNTTWYKGIGGSYGYRLYKVFDTKYYGRVGDLILPHTMQGKNVFKPREKKKAKVLMVKKHPKNKFAKPCDGYTKLHDHKSTGGHLWLPRVNDSRYVVLGLIVSKKKPKPEDCWAVNKLYLNVKKTDKTNTVVSIDWGKHKFYKATENHKNTIKQNGNVFELLRFEDLYKCCGTRSGLPKCGKKWKRKSDNCADFMSQQCYKTNKKGIPLIAEDNSPCNFWCAENDSPCDTIKINWCKNNKKHDLCKCLYPDSHQDYKDQIKGYEKIYALSTPACFYKGCQQSDLADVLKTQKIKKEQLGTRCQSDLKLIDQSIKAAGGSTIIDPTQRANDDDTPDKPSKPSDPSDPSKPSDDDGLNWENIPTSVKIMFMFILVILVIYLFRGNSQPQFRGPPPPPMMGPPPMMQRPMRTVGGNGIHPASY